MACGSVARRTLPVMAREAMEMVATVLVRPEKQHALIHKEKGQGLLSLE